MPKKLTQEEFIRRANEIHNGRYDYSKVQYVNGTTPVIIICPEHGEFVQKPSSHLGGHGCRKCYDESLIGKNKYNRESFIEKARSVHGDKYDYSSVEFVNTYTPPLPSFALFMVNSIKNRMTILCMDAVFVVVEQKWITNHLLKPQSILMVSDTTTQRWIMYHPLKR